MKYKIKFKDDTTDREFDAEKIDAVLEWAYGLGENNTVLAIETPHFMLSVLNKETYEKALTEFDLAGIKE